ncbi:uncharacterized protein [Cebidichthys violaceus]|uniref:uncharacterized protein n=1 Tax=Cebidichthys violaceus TaxID=271503 RepID=UPI0035CACF6B
MIYREKMICSILLLFKLTSCDYGVSVVDVTQSFYQAEENHDITLEWTFQTRTDGSIKSIFIFCQMYTGVRSFILFSLYKGVETLAAQDKRFAGRVKFDKDALREGHLRLKMSRLRTDDSGHYRCDVFTGEGGGSRTCHLNVTAQRDRPKPETTSGGRGPSQTGSPSQAESRGRIGLSCVVGLIVVVTLLGVCYCLRRKHSMNPSPSREQESMMKDGSSLSGRRSKAASEGLVVMMSE